MRFSLSNLLFAFTVTAAWFALLRVAPQIGVAAMAVFFAVLLVGFAYVWKRGDLNWVRAAGHPSAMAEEPAERAAPGPDLQ